MLQKIVCIILFVSYFFHAQARITPAAQHGIAVSFLVGFVHGLVNNAMVDEDPQKADAENHSFMWSGKRELVHGLIFLSANEIIVSVFDIRDDRVFNVMSHGVGQLVGEMIPMRHYSKPVMTMNLALFWGLVQKARSFLFA